MKYGYPLSKMVNVKENASEVVVSRQSMLLQTLVTISTEFDVNFRHDKHIKCWQHITQNMCNKIHGHHVIGMQRKRNPRKELILLLCNHYAMCNVYEETIVHKSSFNVRKKNHKNLHKIHSVTKINWLTVHPVSFNNRTRWRAMAARCNATTFKFYHKTTNHFSLIHFRSHPIVMESKLSFL